jgi:hypothetical protein
MVIDKQWPLFKRAWVSQERMLSPRAIHFGTTELKSESWVYLSKSRYQLAHTTIDYRKQGIPSALPYLSC